MATKIDNIIEELKSLTLIEATELVKQIELIFSVDATFVAGSAVQTTIGSTDTRVKDSEEQTEFSVILEDVPAPKKIAILKIVRSLTGLGLKDAKTLVESYPKTLKENLTKNDANDIKEKLEEAGAKIIIK
uniref:50S ribosomal protein L12, chloroplastic n=1 Tax=Hildenbrandia rubra TaxID=31481 RepID=A0A1C9CG54_9FLOR|nr:ribosomal protein L12 [Hildenbrandia rubra]AOM67378.1 ribosomal protein L12 [Hildenbrandia rubra]